ncbi:Origin recognition complex subunit 4-like isoform X1 [Oopsacas minuta]|uniref:Origin recognition complex subunit 4 n=1 Tax=Oopsacas minuta TaxID=111878 RepID=A0AAV7K2V1_9METZ|nr:Origin recognition complex subunit 4-like isoform X1 [Oopsacas minuta]
MSEKQGQVFTIKQLQTVQQSLFGGANPKIAVPEKRLFEYQIGCYQSLYTLVERSLKWDESNSVLLLGPPGSGKTFITNSMLARINSEYTLDKDMCIVRLNGLIHLNGQEAVQQILRDLKIEGEAKSKANSFETSLTHLLEYLYEMKKKMTPIIFILENFDLFTKHKNQNLLYSLFDISQSNSCPISVVGLTTRLDVIELLEKRVKSRYSHRQLYLATDYTFPDYLRIARQLLDPCFMQDKDWSVHIESILSNPNVISSMKQVYTSSKNVRILQNFITTPLSRLMRKGFRFDPQDFIDSWRYLNIDPYVETLSSITQLEKCVMVSASKLYEQNPNAKLNFEAVYQEYVKFTKQSSSIDQFSRDMVLRAMGHMLELGLLGPVGGGQTKRTKETMNIAPLVTKDQVKKGILDPSVCPTDIMMWAGTICH